jgi:hypothetical protein
VVRRSRTTFPKINRYGICGLIKSYSSISKNWDLLGKN